MDERDFPPLIDRGEPVALSSSEEAWKTFFAMLDSNSRNNLRKALMASMLQKWNPLGPDYTDKKILGGIADEIIAFLQGTRE